MALLAAAALTVATTAAMAYTPASAAVTCTAPTCAEGNTYTAGAQVTYQARQYQALVTRTAHPGAGWNPAATPSLWRDLGACAPSTPPPSDPPPSDPPPSTGCGQKGRPAGKVLQG